ncbi:MAG: hypothetical protein BKP49_02440 [Treponema sp. CETP13]|nr:MAG: hypothetical protein BKP49_02440 [Treponema sp. CETP13]
MILRPSKIDLDWLNNNQPKLCFNNKNIIEGIYKLNSSYKGVALKGNYKIKIDLLVDNIDLIPTVYLYPENLHRILNKSDLKISDLHINSDFSLCLCIPELAKDYLPHGYNLKEFIINLVNPFFYWIRSYCLNKKKPWNDYSHGFQGYKEAFGVDVFETKKSVNNQELYNCIKKKFGSEYLSKQAFRKIIRG